MLKNSAPIGSWVLYAAVGALIAECCSLADASCDNGQSHGTSTCQKVPQPVRSFSLLQSSSLRLKETAAELPEMREHPEEMNHGGEAVVKTLGNWWHPRFPWMGANDDAQETADKDAYVQLPKVQHNITPPLKEPARSADKNFVKDEQPVEREAGIVHHVKKAVVDLVGEKRSMRRAAALALLGFAVFAVCLFYLIELPYSDARQAFWRLLSMTMSVFLSVLIFSATQELMAYGMEHGRAHHGAEFGHSGSLHSTLLILVFLRLCLFWALLQWFLLRTSRKFLWSAAMGRIGSQLVAFAAVDAFGTVQATQLFSQSLLYIGVDIAFSSLLIWGWFTVAESLRDFYVHDDANDEEDESRDEWFAVCRSTENEAAGLVLGLLFSQSIRFVISGHFVPLHGGSIRGKTAEQVWMLLGVGVSLGLLVVPADLFLVSMAYELELDSSKVSAVMEVLRVAIAMTAAWCFTYWGQWAFFLNTTDSGWAFGDKMSTLVVMALILSLICFVSIFVIELLADTYAREQRAGLVALNTALGLAMGLAWEKTFHAAVEGVGDSSHLSSSYVLNNIILILVLCAMVLPAWVLYVFPRANQQQGLDNKFVYEI